MTCSQGLLGVRVGGRRTVRVPAALGFGDAQVFAPYAVVPPSSPLVYDIEVLRLSRTGPNDLMKGIVQCGQGGAGAQLAGCAGIRPLE